MSLGVSARWLDQVARVGFMPTGTKRFADLLRFLAGNKYFHRFLPPIHPSLLKSLRLIRSAAWFPLV
nr:MAG TPA: hypothetical protein [Caudoviricetes sp.]